MARARVTSENLIEAAAELADEIGFDNVTVPALARRVGVKDASLYSRLAGARELRVKIAVMALGELADKVAEALAGRAGKDALVAFANAYRDYAKQHPGRYAAMQLDLDPATAEASAARRHSQMTRAILRGYQLDEPAETDAIRLLHGTFHGYVQLELAGRYDSHPRAVEDSWARSLDALDALLSNWPSA
ncbi:TetR/AcrR family transcriptional regulator [Nocardia brasiliensis]|uniref:Regulatory protein TetR n=1 Tax=Nocardia brasiliensis (strain ATCC 700358 / HUJEG-1) TaxID=1133849 RepID=K0EXD3_NOCB7|nr:TetR/AcrR family transcriptional regulator [Nocardia brasiliensis]AFU04543.1 regulatory protein TetR [Nocardia brasiliensis ATCC 700358]OCF85769.1 TetR family transcriptional regulator [Nocardia brasiliensis]